MRSLRPSDYTACFDKVLAICTYYQYLVHAITIIPNKLLNVLEFGGA